MNNDRYILNLITHEFREMTDDERSGEEFDGIEIPERDVAFLGGNDIDALVIFDYEDERYIGIIHDDELLISAPLSEKTWHEIYRLMVRCQKV